MAFDIEQSHEIRRHVGVHGCDEIRRTVVGKLFEEGGTKVRPHFIEHVAGGSGIELGEQLGGCVSIEFFEDVCRIVRIGGRQRFPFLAVSIEVFLDDFRLEARRVAQSLRKFAWTQ